MKPLLCFVGIFKNEAHNIQKTIESVKPFVDCYCVLDTESTDGTQSMLREAFSGVPGAQYEEPFVDYATSRNRVLELAENMGAVFTLMLSGDEVLSDGKALRDFLEQNRDAEDGAYCVQMRSKTTKWYYPRVLRTDSKWRYQGEIHEVPVSPDKTQTRGPLIPDAWVTYRPSDPERHAKRIKEFDLPTLTKIVDDESKSLEERGQAIWFLAQTHEELAAFYPRTPGSAWLTHMMTAMSLYWRYTEIGEDIAKVNYATFRYLNVAEVAGFFNHEELISRLEMLVDAEPDLPEIRYMLAVHAAQIDQRKGAFLAEEAARVAKASRGKPIHLPTDDRVEWLALRLAAACTKSPKRAKELAAQGIEAGGPREAFEEFLKESA